MLLSVYIGILLNLKYNSDMKKYIIPIFLSLFLLSCSKEEIVPKENAEINDLKRSSFTENNLPEIRFTSLRKNPELTRITLSNLMLSAHPETDKIVVSLRCKKRPELLCTAWDDINSYDLYELSNSPLHTNLILNLGNELANEIVTIKLEYYNTDGKPVQTYNYDIFVYPDGKCALQKPQVQSAVLWGRWDGEYEDDTTPWYWSCGILNDPAGVVTGVFVDFNDPDFPVQYVSFETSSTVQTETLKVNIGRIEFTTKLLGDQGFSTIAVNVKMTDEKKQPIGESQNIIALIQKGDFQGRIKRIRITERDWNQKDDMTFKVVGVVEGANRPPSGSKMTIKFHPEPTGKNPRPIQSVIGLPTRSITNMGSSHERTVFSDNTLTFVDGNPIGKTYSVTAILIGIDGIPLTEPFNAEVIVEGSTPEIVSSTLTSKDEGKTWDLSVTINDTKLWVEKLDIEFEKPYPGPAPDINPISLKQTGEAKEGLKTFIYSGIKFSDNPKGKTYKAKVTFTGNRGQCKYGQCWCVAGY